MRHRHSAILLFFLACSLAPLPLAARSAGAASAQDHITTIRVVVGATSKAFDAGTALTQPTNWPAPPFDDHSWQHVTPVSSAIQRCVSQGRQNWSGFPAYWGANANHGYLLRQHFTLPSAASYAGSTVALRAYVHGLWIGLNGRGIASYDSVNAQWQKTVQLNIGPDLLAGDNVLALQLYQQNGNIAASGKLCNAISFVITVHAHSSAVASSAAGVAALQPAGGATLQRSRPVAISWKSFPKAGKYVLQIWLVRRPGGALLSAGVPASFVTVVTGGTSYSWNARIFDPGTYQYALIPLDSSGKALAQPGNPVTFTLT